MRLTFWHALLGSLSLSHSHSLICSFLCCCCFTFVQSPARCVRSIVPRAPCDPIGVRICCFLCFFFFFVICCEGYLILLFLLRIIILGYSSRSNRFFPPEQVSQSQCGVDSTRHQGATGRGKFQSSRRLSRAARDERRSVLHVLISVCSFFSFLLLCLGLFVFSLLG